MGIVRPVGLLKHVLLRRGAIYSRIVPKWQGIVNGELKKRIELELTLELELELTLEPKWIRILGLKWKTYT